MTRKEEEEEELLLLYLPTSRFPPEHVPFDVYDLRYKWIELDCFELLWWGSYTAVGTPCAVYRIEFAVQTE